MPHQIEEIARLTAAQVKPSAADADMLLPGEAISMLQLGDITDREKRRVFAKLLKLVADTDKAKGTDGITRVRLLAWRDVCSGLRTASKLRDDWSDAADDPEEIRRRIAAERERKKPA